MKYRKSWGLAAGPSSVRAKTSWTLNIEGGKLLEVEECEVLILTAFVDVIWWIRIAGTFVVYCASDLYLEIFGWSFLKIISSAVLL